MGLLTIPQIIELGDISTPLASNYRANSDVFEPRKAYTAPETIALVTDALRWQWEAFPNIDEVRATAEIQVDSIGDEGQIITVFIDDPKNGFISLGSYTLTSGDITTNIIATNLGNALESNIYGYGVSVTNNTVTLTAPMGEGAAMNGITPLIGITQVFFMVTESENRLITENNQNIITQ